MNGDILRCGLNRGLGFKDLDRAESVRRASELAHLMVDAGLILVVALISPFSQDCSLARRVFQRGRFIEIFVDAPLAVGESGGGC